MTSIPTLDTPRLHLRPVMEHDIDAINAACSKPQVTAYTLFATHASREESSQFVHGYAFTNYSRGIPDPLAITRKEQPEQLIGCTGARWNTQSNRCMELGYWLDDAHWGQGYATEAVRGLVAYLFEAFQPVRIQAHAMRENQASCRVLERAGFTYEGTLRSAIYRQERFHDICMYSLLASDWTRHIPE